MDPSQIRITADPQTAALCRFTVNRPLYPNASFYFDSKERAQNSPLAKQIFDLEGVTSVLISHDQIVVNKGGYEDWPVIGKKIGATIREWFASGLPAVSDEARKSLPEPEELRGRVQDVLDLDVNPAVASHGGFVELIDVRGNDVYLRMGGGCQGCGMATMTLRQGVETAIRRAVPEVGAIFDSTDHAAGRNPYYAPAGH
jgi:Fe-S cluster biogenesis protein NfuA